MKKLLIPNFFLLAIIILPLSAFAAKPEYKIIIKDHKFYPDILEVKQNEKFKLIVENQDRTIEEFESDDLHLEKIVGGNKTIKLNVKALKAGEYEFIGEFHKKTAKGKIIAK